MQDPETAEARPKNDTKANLATISEERDSSLKNSSMEFDHSNERLGKIILVRPRN